MSENSPATGRRREKRAGRNAGSDTVRQAFDVQAGRLKPLSTQNCADIYAAALDILESIGLSDASAEMVNTVTASGGAVSGDGRLLFPRAMVQKAVAAQARPVTLCGQISDHDMTLQPGASFAGTGGAAPYIVDIETGQYRDSGLQDLYDAARLSDRLENIRFFSRSLVARDVTDPRQMDINTAYASLAGTTKHVLVSASLPEHVAPIAEMCYAVAGSEAAFRARPFLSLNVNHVVPPLRFHPESCAVLAAAAQAGIPVMVNVFGQLGASSPVTIAGSVAQTMAEALAGMVYVWLIAPEAIAICGPRPMITDLRTGGMSGGSGEQALATAVAMQLCNWLGLPSSTIAGATDSKVPDAQAGYEKALAVSAAVQAGAGLVTQACGMQAGLMGVSFESYVIDNDMLGAVMRAAAPVQVTAETLNVSGIADVVRGEGHFLGRPETFQRMKTDFLYPQIADRRPPLEWEAAGSQDIRSLANSRARAILAEHYPTHLSGIEDALRAQFDIVLPPEQMRPK